MIKEIYSVLRALIIFTIAIAFVFTLLVSHKSVLPYLAQKYLTDYGINYSSLSGSLLGGVTIKDVNYENAITIKSLSINYNPLFLLRPTPKISLVKVEGLKADINHFTKQKSSEEELGFIKFQLDKLTLDNSEILYEDKTIKFDALSKTLLFDNSLHVKQLKLENTSIKDTNTEITLALNSQNIDYKDSLKLGSLEFKSNLLDNNYGYFQTDFSGTYISYHNELANIKNFTLSLQSPYGYLETDATLKDNTITAKAKITPKDNLTKEYLGFLTGLPQTFNIDLNASKQKVSISTYLNAISLEKEQNSTAKNSFIQASYLVEKQIVEFKTDYDLEYQDYALHVKQSGSVNHNLEYQSSLKSKILKSPINLPIDSFDVFLEGNSSSLYADMNSSHISMSTSTKDFNIFVVDTDIKKLPLDFVSEYFKDDILSSKISSHFQVSPLTIKSQIEAQNKEIKYSGDIETDLHSFLVKGDLSPRLKSKIFENINPKIIEGLNFVYFNDPKQNMLNLDSKRINITIFEKDKLLEGWGDLDKNSFEVSGKIEKNGKSDIKLSANFPSIKELVKDLKLEDESIVYDAEINLEAQVSYDDQIELKSFIKVPWYYVLLDDETHYAGQDLSFEVQKDKTDFILNNYNIDILDHRIYSKKPSIIGLDTNQTIQIKELWIYDNLLVEGDISTKKKNINLKVHSDKFSYEGEEGKITAKTDISVQINENEQNIEGYITLLDGQIRYVPKKSYSITDDDIIIIQDINNEVINNRFINVHVNSIKPIKYKVENIDLDISPDFAIFKEKGENIKILGLASINKGEVTAIDKLFTLAKSEVYFYEDNSNPMLSLTINHQTLDYKDIEIYVTGKLESPVIIFSSKQSLSQNDIMSYVLFGEASSSTFNTSSQNNNNKIYLGSLLLGTQLKQVLNKSSSLKIDTLNILTTEEGSLGYEIGSRINKDLRVIYKNNVVSSVVVQYNVNRSVRVDVDVNQESQGVSIIYTKDF